MHPAFQFYSRKVVQQDLEISSYHGDILRRTNLEKKPEHNHNNI